MVKPPKTMQPEAVNLQEITKKGTRGMGGDDFRNYMARKIDLQRKQFGAVLPPPPEQQAPAPSKQVRFAKSPDDKTKTTKVQDMSSLLKSLKKRHGSKKSRKRVKKAKRQESSNIDAKNSSLVARMPQHSVNDDHGESSQQAMKPPPASPIHHQKPSPSDLRQRPDLFLCGVIVLVNGYTDPDTDTLMRLLHKHGGDLEKYETSRVTHILAQNLSAAKASMYKRQRNPRPVCRPEWIVDCVDAKRLLPYGDYLLKEVQPEATSSVKNYFGKAKTAPQEESVVSREAAAPSQSVDKESPRVTSLEEVSMETWEAKIDVNGSGSHHTESKSQESGGLSVVSDEDPSLDNKSSKDKTLRQGTRINTKGTETAERGNLDGDTTVVRPSCIAETSRFEKEMPKPDVSFVAEESVSIVQQPSGTSFADGRIRTVGTDPNFLDSYFKSSRLSFIGSFQQRARHSPTKNMAAAKTSKEAKRFVFLVDMDSFFASVVLRNYPEYRNKPVAISHMGKQTQNGRPNIDPTLLGTKNSTSECATCNYEARKYGIKKGMFLGRARELCPELVVLQYDFEGYEEVSEQVADILHRVADAHDGTVEQVSCDESYMELFLADDASSSDHVASVIAEEIRKEIFEATQGCTATVGIASNKFLAKLAADQVKPDKSMVVNDHRSLLESLNLRDLHGIGYRTERKLSKENLVSVRDVWELGSHGEGELVRILGPGLGKKISLFCQGIDDRPVKAAERKTIGAECNYGVRFDGPYGVSYMVEGLAKEVQKRMQSVGVKGSRVTLKVKQRKQGAKPPPKFLGHGSCHNLSKSGDMPVSTDESYVISRIALNLLEQLDVPEDDIRGMGIVVSKLVDENAVKDVGTDPSGRITSWFGKSTTSSASSIGLEASRCSLQKDFEHAGQTTGACVELPTDEGTAPYDSLASKLPSTDSAAPSQADISSSTGSRSEAVGYGCEDESASSPTENGSAIVLSQLEQDSLTEEGSDCHRNDMDDDDDIALPSFSQIHMSQVAELPSPMRESIIARVSIGGSNVRTSQEVPAKATRHSVSRKRARVQNMDPLYTKDGGGMKQLSVKRMMKLAAVKSGTDKTLSDSLGGDVSLTQLECLPLEMQLQVANNEDLFSGYRSPTSVNKKRQRSSPSVSRASFHASAKASKARASQEETNAQQESDKSSLYPQVQVPLISEQRSFYQENISPLKVFMDENPEAAGDALQKVKEFLSICVSERRFSDAVKILRSIKNRSDSWSGNAYQEIVTAANEQTRSVLGRPLDLEGLCL